MTSLTVQAALIKDARGIKENNLGSYQHCNTYIILPRYLFRNPLAMHPKAFRRISHLPKGIVHGCKLCTLSGECNFRNQQGGGVSCESKSKSDQETTVGNQVSRNFYIVRHRAYRAPMNIPTELEAVWRTVATTKMDAPKAIVGRRPSPSLI